MTVSNQQVRVSYKGDGISTVWPIPFPFFLPTDLLVLQGGATLFSGYSASGGAGNTGFLTTSAPVPVNVNLQIILNDPLTQLVALVDGTAFPSATLNEVHDRAIQIMLRLSDRLARTLSVPDGDVTPSTVLPAAAARANTVLGFDSLGNVAPVVSVPSGTLSRGSIGSFLYPIAQAETAAGVIPGDLSYPVLNPFRYGADGQGGSNDTTALMAVRGVLAQLVGIQGWRSGAYVAGYPQTAAEAVAMGIDPTIQIVNYGASAGNVLRHYSGTDITKAFNDTLTCNGYAYLDVPGLYPLDGLISVGANQEIRLGKNVILQRQSARTANTSALVLLKGNYAKLTGGTLWSQNDAPSGIACCGHFDTTTSAYNSFWWHLADVDIIGKDYLGGQTPLTITSISNANPGVVGVSGTAPPNGTLVTIRNATGMTGVNFNTYIVAGASGSTFQLTGNGLTSGGNIDTTGLGTYTGAGLLYTYPSEGLSIGVYIPSSQPQFSSAVCANYYGKVTNVHVQTASTPFWLTDQANAHQLINITFNGAYWNGIVIQGAYGNRVSMGFCDSAYQNGVTAIYLRVQGKPHAPFPSSIGSSRNVIEGANFELGLTGHFGVSVSQSDGKQTNNWVRFRWNTVGTPISDAAQANDIFVDTASAVLQNGLVIGGSLNIGGTTPVTGVSATQLALGTSSQLTVGSAGGASALPANPSRYLQVNYEGTLFVIPLYKQS